MQSNYLLIPLSYYDEIEEKLLTEVENKNIPEIEKMAERAYLIGQMKMLVNPKFVRIFLDTNSVEKLNDTTLPLKLKLKNEK